MLLGLVKEVGVVILGVFGLVFCRFLGGGLVAGGDCDLVVPFALRVELYAVEELDVTHEARHYQAALRSVQDLGNLWFVTFNPLNLLESILIMLIKLVHQHIVIVLCLPPHLFILPFLPFQPLLFLLLLATFTGLHSQTDQQPPSDLV